MKYAAISCLVGLTLAAGAAGCSNASEPGQNPEAPASEPTQIGGLAGRNLVSNGDFGAGELGWTIIARDAQVTVDRSGRGGSAGLRVRALEDTRVRATYDLGQRLLPRGTHLQAAAWLRASLVAQEVRLTLDEIHPDGSYQAVRETVRTYDRAWESVRTTAVTEEPGSRLRLRIDLMHLPAGASIRLDDVWVSREEPRVAVHVDPYRLDNGCAVSRRGVPVCSAYFGAAHGRHHDPTTWERSLGRPLGVHRTYFPADQVDDAVATARRDLAAGRLPWISLEVPYSWAAMAAGRGDRWVRAVGRRLADVPGPVWVAFHHDPVGDGRIREWTAMQQRLAPMIRGAAPNAAYTVVLDGWFAPDGKREYHLRKVWPNGTKIDVAGFELFAHAGPEGNSDGERTTSLAKTYFAPLSRWAENRGLAWAVAATGYPDDVAEVDPTWLYRTYQQLLHHGGVAFTYADITEPWTLTTPEKRRQFQLAIRHTPRL